MKARPLKQLPDGTKEYCEPNEATHVLLALPGPFTNRMLPVQIAGTREGTGNWTWNGDTEKPTLRPSVLTWNDTERCHTWITEGQAIFLADCTHEFAGQTLDLLEVE